MENKSLIRIPTILILAIVLFANVGFVLSYGYQWNSVQPRDLQAEGIYNANRTGHSDVAGFTGFLRNVPGQKIHSNYQINTNACASCHMTHTAQGSGLQFQERTYNTCTACHFADDMSPYNILAGADVPRGDDLFGGRFYDGNYEDEYLLFNREGVSQHLTTGSFTHADAVKNVDGEKAAVLPAGWWDESFTCSSCHNPHGSYGDRNFNANINGRAQRYGEEDVITLIVDPESPGSGRYVPYAVGLNVGETVPWLYYGADSPLFEDYGVVIRDGATIVSEKFWVNTRDGYVRLKEDADLGVPVESLTISFSQAMILDIEYVEHTSEHFTWSETVYYGGTVEFCAACHEGYIIKDEERDVYRVDHANLAPHVIGENLYAVYEGNGYVMPEEQGYLKLVGLKLEVDREDTQATLTCLTCHFAHGTDTDLMVDRDFLPIADNPDKLPAAEVENTYHLRFGKTTDGWESCFTCHDGPENAPRHESTLVEEPDLNEEEFVGDEDSGEEADPETGTGEADLEEGAAEEPGEDTGQSEPVESGNENPPAEPELTPPPPEESPDVSEPEAEEEEPEPLASESELAQPKVKSGHEVIQEADPDEET